MTKTLFLFLLLYSTSGLTQNTYYISSDGNDRNAGTSTSKPWKTLKQYLPGNTYLFRRNDTFHLQVPYISNPESFNKIVISAYGNGKKPVISNYTKIKRPQWTKVNSSVWKVDLTRSLNFSGFLKYNSNIGLLKINGAIVGNKLPNVSSLLQQWDFCSDATFLYLRSATDPSAYSVEFTSNGVGITLCSNLEVRNLEVLGSGGHGIQGAYIYNALIDSVKVTEIGGSYLPGFGDGTVRYGNGIEFWNGGTLCKVQNCEVSQVYDAAFTMQGIGAGVHFQEMTFQYNLADRNEQSFEAWAREGAIGFTNCLFTYNKCTNAGYGWSHAVRPDKTQGVHILTYTWDAQQVDLRLMYNTFHKAVSALYYHNFGQDIPAFTSRENEVFLNPGTQIRSMYPDHTIENASEFVISTGKEVLTKFNTLQDQYITRLIIRRLAISRRSIYDSMVDTSML